MTTTQGGMMRNRILFITRNTIPYIKELQPLAGSVAGCLVMQQLDYWFERKPNGFWKFLEPSSRHSKYRPGDSWCEELGMSAEEFRTAFDRLGIRYKSKCIFDEAQDKFQRKYFYCSYLDRRENLTYYFRNHDLVDEALDALIINNKQSVTVNCESRFTVNQETRFTGNRESKSLEIKKVDLQETKNPHFNSTEITSSENTQILLLPKQSVVSDKFCGGSESELVFPRQLSEEEIKISYGLIRHLEFSTQQKLMAELEGALNRPGTINRTPVSYLKGMVLKEKKGNFTLDLGLGIMSKKRTNDKNLLGALTNTLLKTDPVACAMGLSMLSVDLQASIGNS